MILRSTHWLFFVLLISTQFCLHAVTANAQTFRTDEPRHTHFSIDAKAIESSLDPFIAEEMKKQHLPGLVFALVKDGRVVLSEGYDWANLKQQIPATPERTLARKGDKKDAIDALEEALKLGFSGNESLQRDTHLDSLRKETRFKTLLNGDPKAITQEPSRYRSEDVRYQNEKIGLAALLLLPESDKKVPGAVILQGSGPSDRTNQWARAISDELMRKGIAVLLTDKRGSGKSEGNWQTSDFSELAGDAIAGVEYLRQRREIDPERVGLVGLSQGGWVAPLAAAKSEQVAFVITVSAASVSFAEQTFTEVANTARQAGLSEEHIREVLELNRAAAAYATTGNWSNYSKLREEALKSPWSKIAAGFPSSPDLPIWTFLRGVGAYDPIPYWIQVTEPTLVLYGEKDEHDNVPVAESVRRLKHAFEIVGKENYRIVVIPNAGHSFIDLQQKQLVPEFVKALTSWVEEFVVR